MAYGITPACAGKSRVVQFNLSLILGSPPHVRGKANSAAGLVLLTGITPACAGKRGAGRMGGTGTQDHPRMCGKSVSWYVMTSSTWDHLRVCGEKAGAAGCRSCREGSPPRMRGKVGWSAERSRPEGITPAYAGKSFLRSSSQLLNGDHPRVCGEKTKKIP